ncbi:hypothetical protein Lal_00019947 [Lupinus albus]|nr:hypothetical protein Lal_00019947 [Lupinus albus]
MFRPRAFWWVGLPIPEVTSQTLRARPETSHNTHNHVDLKVPHTTPSPGPHLPHSSSSRSSPSLSTIGASQRVDNPVESTPQTRTMMGSSDYAKN